ncbi:hypothetical protein CPB86DRAFT_813381 [Serendipita vermifera]|nr:hypothetical protein CPB86DRAFT_813381 [Serendipita vermifera]
MLFPTALILAVLSITPTLAVPVLSIDSDASSLVARDEPQQVILEARGEAYGLDLDMMEKRDLADEESLVELVARSPEPEPLPEPIEGELEDVGRRSLLGAVFKGLSRGISAARKAHNAKQHYNNNNNVRYRNPGNRRYKRSFWSKIKGIFNKVKKPFATVAKMVLKTRGIEEPELKVRSLEEPELEVRDMEPQLETRDVEDVVELDARDVEESMELEARDVEESMELEARDVDEPELEARDVEEVELEARDIEPELEARDVEDMSELEARELEEPELEARAFEEEEF